MKLSFLTDEATQSFDEALALAKRHGLDGLELRSIEDMPIDRVPHSRLRDWRVLLDGAGLQVPCIAGSYYKCGCSRAELEEQRELLERLCDAADLLGCALIRGFAFFRPPEGARSPEELAPYFRDAEAVLRRRRKRLLLEADPSVNTPTHASLAALLRRLDRACFGAVYDPGNSLYATPPERPFPDAYEAVKPYFAHVHVKDVVFGADGAPRCVRPGDGLVDYRALLGRLVQEGYGGWLSLETHYRKDLTLTEEQMRAPQGAAFSAGGLAATAESAEALRALLARAEEENG